MKQEITSLTSLRFIAAFYVFLFHAQIHIGSAFSNEIINKIIGAGYIAMTLFFILSGYILAYVYSEFNINNIKKYYINRFARIYPTYFAYGLIGIISFIYSLDSIPNTLNIEYTYIFQFILGVLAFVFMFQAWYPSLFSVWNFGGSWSLSVELFFYILYPAIRTVINVSNKKTLLYILFFSYMWASIPILFFYCFSGKDNGIMNIYTYSSPIFRLGEFIFGILIHTIFIERKYFSFNSAYIKILLTSLYCILFIILTINNVTLEGLIRYSFIAIPVFGLTLYYLNIEGNWLLERKIFIYLGRISYSFYLAQFTTFVVFIDYLKDMNVNMILKWFFAFLITFLISILMYHLIEEPSRKYIRKKYS